MLFFLLILLAIAATKGSEEKAIMTMKNVKCNVNEKFVFNNFSCFAKSYSRSVSTLNVKLYFKEPLKQIFMTSVLQFKYGMIYRDALVQKSSDWCKAAKTGTSNDLGFDQILTVFKAGDPGIVHECPYTDFIMRNWTLQANVMKNVFPTGDYKLKFAFWDAEGTPVFDYTAICGFKSSNRDTFGR